VALRDNLPEGGGLASRRIAALQRLVTTLQSCANPMVSPFAIYFQVPTLVVIAIARWRAKHGMPSPDGCAPSERRKRLRRSRRLHSRIPTARFP
jgi:hypothetical protein